jgi:hypothetical protein
VKQAFEVGPVLAGYVVVVCVEVDPYQKVIGTHLVADLVVVDGLERHKRNSLRFKE